MRPFYIYCCACICIFIVNFGYSAVLGSNYKFYDSSDETDNELYDNNLLESQNEDITASLDDGSGDNEENNVGVNFVNFYNGVSNRLYDGIADTLRTRFSELLFETLNSFNLSQPCYSSTLRVLRGIYERQLWAIKFFDATAKLPNGMAEGVLSSLGDYDECLDIKSAQTPNENETSIYGRYCLAEPVIDLAAIVYATNNDSVLDKILTPENLEKWQFEFNINTLRLVMAMNATRFAPFRMGLCVPSHCSANDIENALNSVFQPIIRTAIKVGPKCDSRADEKAFNVYQKTAISFFFLLTILVLISTLIEIYLTNKNSKLDNNNKKCGSKLRKSLLAFSIITNTETLFRKPRRRLETADTLFLVFIIWIFWARAYIAPLMLNMLGLKRVFNSIVLQMVTAEKYFWLRTPFPMAILFLFGGIFISYDFFGRRVQKKIFPLLLWYPRFLLEKWLRFLVRMTGPLMLVWFASSLGDGPYWHLGEHFFLKTNFWPNIFFYNNYAKTIEKSINHPSIFLALIFQLQCISPVFMIPLLFYRRFGAIFNALLITVWVFIVVSPRILFGTKIAPFEVNDMHTVEEIRYSLRRYSLYTTQYVAEFALGVLTGYALRNQRILDSFFADKRWLKLSIAVLSPVLCVMAFIWGDSFKNVNIKPNLVNLILWLSIGKIMFATGMACICYALCAKAKGIFYRFSTCNVIRLLNRLSIGILLIHADVTYFRLFNNRENYVITTSYVLKTIYFNFPITVMLAYIIYVLFECPVVNLINVYRNATKSIKEEVLNDITIENTNKTNGSNNNTAATEVELEKLKFIDE